MLTTNQSDEMWPTVHTAGSVLKQEKHGCLHTSYLILQLNSTPKCVSENIKLSSADIDWFPGYFSSSSASDLWSANPRAQIQNVSFFPPCSLLLFHTHFTHKHTLLSHVVFCTTLLMLHVRNITIRPKKCKALAFKMFVFFQKNMQKLPSSHINTSSQNKPLWYHEAYTFFQYKVPIGWSRNQCLVLKSSTQRWERTSALRQVCARLQ